MDRRVINALFVNDDDLNCDCKETTIDNLTIDSVAFRQSDIRKFDMIIYKGKRGEKILRSIFTDVGKITK